MKPIKFRVWDQRLDRYWFPSTDTYLSFAPDWALWKDTIKYDKAHGAHQIATVGHRLVCDDRNGYLEQCTGERCKKTGKDIYTGDIVEEGIIVGNTYQPE